MILSRPLGSLVIAFSALTMMPAWGQIGADLMVSGTLIYGWGETVKQTELGPKDTLTRMLYQQRGEQISDLSKVDEDRFLFSEQLNYRIKIFNRQTGEVLPVIPGTGPTYIPQHGKLFFYRSEPGAMRMKLLIADWKDLTGSIHVVDEGPFAIARQVIPVDTNRVVFLPRDNRGTKVKMFDMRTSETFELPLAGCVPKLWRTATKQLLCFDIEREEHVLIGLDGQNRERGLPFGVVPLLYLAELDAALIGFEEGRDHMLALYPFAAMNGPGGKVILQQTIVGEGGALLFSNPSAGK